MSIEHCLKGQFVIIRSLTHPTPIPPVPFILFCMPLLPSSFFLEVERKLFSLTLSTPQYSTLPTVNLLFFFLPYVSLLFKSSIAFFEILPQNESKGHSRAQEGVCVWWEAGGGIGWG